MTQQNGHYLRTKSAETPVARWVKLMLVAGALLMGLAIVLGAIGSHALESFLVETAAENVERRLDNWDTGVKYQAFHGLALLALGAIFRMAKPNELDGWIRAAVVLFLIGTLLFCGMLYLWVLTQQTQWVALVPIGGLSFIGGWFCAVVGLIRVR